METWPVGPPGTATELLGGLTANSLTLVAPVTPYSVVVFVPWFEIQKGLNPLMKERPQGFFNCESVMLANPETSETRFVWA